MIAKFTACLLAILAALSTGAAAQEPYPTRKAITLVSPYPAGGASDVLTRILAARRNAGRLDRRAVALLPTTTHHRLAV